MSSTTMASGIIKGSPTSCCSVGLRKLVGTGLYNVATGWVASCVTTIKRLHELAGQSWQMAVRLRPAPRSGLIVVGKRWPPTNSRVPPTFPCATGRSTYRAVTDWDSDKTQINFCIEQTGPTDHYFDHTRDAASFRTVAISCMIGTRSTPSRSERSSNQVASNRSRYLLIVRI